MYRYTTTFVDIQLHLSIYKNIYRYITTSIDTQLHIHSGVKRAGGGHVGRGDENGGCTATSLDKRLYSHSYKEDIRLDQEDIRRHLSICNYTTIYTTIKPLIQLYNHSQRCEASRRWARRERRRRRRIYIYIDRAINVVILVHIYICIYMYIFLYIYIHVYVCVYKSICSYSDTQGH